MVEIPPELLAKLENATIKVIKSYTVHPINDELMKPKAAAGAHNLDRAKVEVGRLEIITSIAAIDVNSSPTVVRLGVYDGNLEYWHKSKTSPTANETVLYTGMLTLGEGDRIRGRFEGVTLNDDLYVFINGYWINL